MSEGRHTIAGILGQRGAFPQDTGSPFVRSNALLSANSL